MFLKTFLFSASILGVEIVVHSALASGFEQTRKPVAERLENDHLRATHQERERLAAARVPPPSFGVYEDFRAVIHVHAEDSDHTQGTRTEVLQAAKTTGVKVVLWTDHRGPKPDTWRGIRDGVLFIAGSEDGTGGLRFPEYDTTGNPIKESGMRFLSHIEERYDADPEAFAGMEISNRHTDAILDRSLYLELMKAADNPDRWKNLTNAFRLYPDEFFGAGTDYRKEIFAKWDREIQRKSFTGIAANDAHQNQIFLGTTFDPYEISFRNLSTHILARELSEASIRQSLREGHVYVSHDWLCDPSGFTFSAINNLGVFTMGDPVPLAGRTRIVATTPVACKMRLFHNGAVVNEATGTNLTFQAASAGAYRLEAWLDIDGEARPWIYSNPVYLKIPDPGFMKLPSADISPRVEARRNIAYTEGNDADAEKHRLDLYIPSGKAGAPVFFFIHGGAWRSGDRSQYPAVGNRFAKEGILTVIPSYRLAPEHAHPAQIEDVASAFNWVVRHIAEFGGDTNRIFVGGHSAGGHLAALLSLDENALKPFALSPKLIRGTIALSGVFNLTLDPGQASVFGGDPEIRKNASPLFHVSLDRPPFLVTYCQWDYWSLPTQAKEFHAALSRSSAPSQLVFIPNENHISEMVHVPNDDDPTARAILDFIAAHSKSEHTAVKGADRGLAWARHVIDDSSDGADGIRLADVNGDNLLDITTGWEEGGKVRVYLNPGFERATGKWHAVTVGEVGSVEDAVFVDLDADGATDVVSSCEGKVRTMFIHWAPKDKGDYLKPESWRTEAIPITESRAQWMYCLPLQVDGKNGIDLIAGAKGPGAELGWLEAPANPRDLEGWKWHPLCPVGWIMSIQAADMDGDGDFDIVATDRKGQTTGCFWLENPGAASDAQSTWSRHDIGGLGREVLFMAQADLDRDGLTDCVVAAKPQEILFLRRRESGADSWDSRAIPFPENTGRAKAINAGDLDMDGRLDLVVTCEGAEDPKSGVFWLSSRSSESGTVWDAHEISGPVGVKYDLVELIDFDGDGDLDVLTCEERSNLGVFWYENPARNP